MPTYLSTDEILQKERPAYWNFLVSSVLGRLHTIPEQNNGPFRGSISYSHLATIPVAQVSSSQLTVVRPENFIQDPQEDYFKINFQLKGNATLTQRGRSAHLAPGMWTIYDNTQPYELKFHADYQQLLFLVPRSELINRMPTIDLHLATSQTNQQGAGRLLQQLASSALEESDSMSGAARQSTGQMLLDMLMMSLASTHQDITAGGGRFENVEQIIEMNLANPALSVDFIAQKLYLSKRSIQKLYAGRGTTVNRSIWAKRLARCQDNLADPRLEHLSIQTIALRWGFRTQAHFSRLFKEQVGMPPSAWRKQMLV